MSKKLLTVFIVGTFLLSASAVLALTKPAPDADIDNLSYVFYLYYSNGQLLADRDYEIKYDVVAQTFTPETIAEEIGFKGEIVNFKSEVVKTFFFDPRKGNQSFSGKVMIYGPYVSDGLRVNFYNNQGSQLLTIFVNGGSLCDDNSTCNSATGENEKTCPNDCKQVRPTPTPVVIEEMGGFLGGFDLNTILIYVVGGVGVIVLGWFGWKWWKKRRESAFIPPMPPPPPSQSTPFSTPGL